jgi:hypothetical protein
MSREAERLGAVEAQRAEREEPDCGEAAEREFWVGCANMKKRSPRNGRDILVERGTFLSAGCGRVGRGKRTRMSALL